MIELIFAMMLLAPKTMVFDTVDVTCPAPPEKCGKLVKLTSSQQKILDETRKEHTTVGRPKFVSKLKVTKNTKGTIYLPLANRSNLEIKNYRVEVDGKATAIHWTDFDFMIMTEGEDGYIFNDNTTYVVKNLGGDLWAILEIKKVYR